MNTADIMSFPEGVWIRERVITTRGQEPTIFQTLCSPQYILLTESIPIPRHLLWMDKDDILNNSITIIIISQLVKLCIVILDQDRREF